MALLEKGFAKLCGSFSHVGLTTPFVWILRIILIHTNHSSSCANSSSPFYFKFPSWPSEFGQRILPSLYCRSRRAILQMPSGAIYNLNNPIYVNPSPINNRPEAPKLYNNQFYYLEALKTVFINTSSVYILLSSL